MSKAQSWQAEMKVDDVVVHPLEIGEFGEGTEGTIDVVDGDVKYKIRNLVHEAEEIAVKIFMKNKGPSRLEFEKMQEFAQSRTPRDIYVNFRDGEGLLQDSYLLRECDCIHGKKNGFNLSSKEADTKSYTLLPKKVVRIE